MTALHAAGGRCADRNRVVRYGTVRWSCAWSCARSSPSQAPRARARHGLSYAKPTVSCLTTCKKLLTVRKVVERYQEIDKSQVAGTAEGWTTAPAQIHRWGVFVRQSNPGAPSSPQAWRWRVPLVKSLTAEERPLLALEPRPRGAR